MTAQSKTDEKRLDNLDLLKGAAIIAMVFCHPIIRLASHRPGFEKEFLYFFGDVILGDYLIVAHGFMFAMGVGMIYSRRQAPSDLIKRGIRIYLSGFLLNLLRYGLYALGYGLITGEYETETLEALFALDILQFAGLALIATGILRRLKLHEVHLLILGAVLSAAGQLIPPVDTGSYLTNVLLGNFVF